MSNANLPTDPKIRKEMPIARGLLDYFPDAVATIARVSYIGNKQHNPGEEMHWARDKSSDHADCIVRHLIERGSTDTDGLRHTAKMAWRALALLQTEIESSSPPGNGGARAAGEIDIAHAPIHGVICHTQGFLAVEHPRKPRIYIAGPMRGYEDFNFPAFDAARDLAIMGGWDPISPADLDREHGIDETTPPNSADSPEASRTFAERDCRAILSLRAELGDALALLPGWTASTGARAEFFLADWVGLRVLDATTMRPFTVAQCKQLWDNAGGVGLGELKAAGLRIISREG